MLDLLVVERRGRLVEYKQFGVGVQRLGDLQKLLFAGFQFAHGNGGVDVHAQMLKELGGLGDHALFVQRAQAGEALLAQEYVFIDAQIVKEVEFLMHKGDAGLLGGLHRDVAPCPSPQRRLLPLSRV